MKTEIVLILLATAFVSSTQAATFTNSVSVDSFVRATAPTSNYGGAGANSVSGASATNTVPVANGAFDTFIRFNTFTMATNFNALYGTNKWAITGAALQVTEQAAPNNAIFNRGKGAFEIRWIANDNWTEGSGSPASPGTTGIVYTNEPSLLNGSNDVSLGTYTNAGIDGIETFSLALANAMVNDIQAGGEVGFFMIAVDPMVGFTFGSRSFNPTSARPFLIVSVAPKPSITSVSVSGSDLFLNCTNGASGATYTALVSTDVTQPLSQWTAVATNTIANDGAFQLTISNALATPAAQQFYSVQMQ